MNKSFDPVPGPDAVSSTAVPESTKGGQPPRPAPSSAPDDDVDQTVEQVRSFAETLNAPIRRSSGSQPLIRLDGLGGGEGEQEDRRLPGGDRERKALLEERLRATGVFAVQSAPKWIGPTSTGRTVVATFGRNQVTYTVARHHLTGMNCLGQEGTEYPLCLVDLSAWSQSPWDLRLTRWYPTEQEAIKRFGPREPSPKPEPPPPGPEPTAWVATFPGPVEVEVRGGKSRWEMFERRFGKCVKRKGFASAYADHAKRCAVSFFGEPLTDWRALDEEVPDEQRDDDRQGNLPFTEE